MYHLTKEQLLSDLEQAFIDACRHKSRKRYVSRFKMNLESNLQSLCDELWSRTYRPLPSSCFVVTYPKCREVFAAEFRDRVVHHLYYNYTQELFSRTFIYDSYSCIPQRGTHFGIARLEKHIRSESHNYTIPCYVLKMDISGYFMHIDRKKLTSVCISTLRSMSSHRILKRVPKTWSDTLDLDFLEYLTEQIAQVNPAKCCRIVGSGSDWDMLPYGKSLFHMPEGTGLPIGNLTSQLFSNIYLNVFDQWMKREVGCRHYGRYVDDFYVVSSDRNWLRSLIPRIDSFLEKELSLKIQKAKTTISDVSHGVSFLGAYIKPGRKYIDNKTLSHMRMKLDALSSEIRVSRDPERLRASLNSFLGVLGHYKTYNIRRRLMLEDHDFSEYGFFIDGIRHFYSYAMTSSG